MRKYDLSDYFKFKMLSNAQISPDGKRTAYVQFVVRDKEDDYQSDVYIVTDEKESFCITDGVSNSGSPTWAPDGKTLAYISNMEGKRALYFYNIESRISEKVVEMPYGISFPSWSPDGKKIAFFSQVKVSENSPYRVVKRLKQKMDALSGFIDYSKESRLYILDVDTKEVNQLTPDDFSIEPAEWSGVFSASWSNEGDKVAFAAKIQDPLERDLHPYNANIFIVDLKSKKIEGIKRVDGPGAKPIWSKDDKAIYFVGHTNEFQRATCQRLCKIDLETKDFSILSKDLDRGLDDYLNGDTFNGYNDIYPKISEIMNEIYFVAGNCGRTNLFGMNLDTGEIRPVIDGDRAVSSFSLTADGTKLSFIYADEFFPGDVATLDLQTQVEKRLTEVNEAFIGQFPPLNQEHIPHIRPDGITVDGWIVKPVGYEEGKKYPTVLFIHGGPMLAYGHNFNFVFQWYANNGYAVIYCNPRGSRGYGQDHTRALKDNYGGKDFEDFMSFVDHAIATGIVDADRMGVTGISYGGFMTNWIMTHTDRFKCAAPEASVSNWMTMYGMSDFGFMSNELLLMDGFDDLSKLWKISPLAYAENVTSPVFIIHSEMDMRCPIDQGEQLFVRLKHLGKDVEMVRFPGQNHMMAFLGKPSFRFTKHTMLMEFFEKHLK